MKQVRVYLAAPFSFQPRMKLYAQELRSLGMEVTSRWLDETVPPLGDVEKLSETYCADTAFKDVQDIANSNVFILFTLSDDDLADPSLTKKTVSSGGRHFEAGLACGLRLLNAALSGFSKTYPIVIVCGKNRENIFYEQEHIVREPTWDSTVSLLLRLAHENCEYVGKE